MKVAVFSSHKFESASLAAGADGKHELVFLEPSLSSRTAPLADGFDAVCIFVNDVGSSAVFNLLA
jgi:D-lactate dehydrogenase